MAGSLYMKSRLIRISLILSLSLTVVMTACGKKEEVQTQPVLSSGDETLDYSYAECEYGSIEQTERIRCEYKKHGEQGVYFPTSGKRIANVYVREGDEVKKGDVLVELDVESISSRIAELEYRIRRNELMMGYLNTAEELDSRELLYNYEYMTGQTDDDKDAYDENLKNLRQNNGFIREGYQDQLEFDRRELKSLRDELAASSVKAEFDGRVNSIQGNLQGSTTNAEKCIMTIVDDQEGYFETEADNLVEYIDSNTTLYLKVSGGNGRGDYKVQPMDMDKWGETQQFSVISGENAMALEAGTKGELFVVTAKRDNVLILPSRCIHPAGDEQYVYVVNDEGRRDVVWIKTGVSSDTMTEITEGLSEGDRVILR